MFVRLRHVRCVRLKGRQYWYHRVTNLPLPADETGRARLVLEVNAALERGDSVEEVRAVFGEPSRPPSRVKHVKHVRSKGRDYFYHRVTGEKLLVDEAERVKRVEEINDTLLDRSNEGWRKGPIPGSFGDLIGQYKTSVEFKRLADSTRATYLRYLDALERGPAAETMVADIDAPWLYQYRDGIRDRPRVADITVSIFSVLLNFAVARGWRSDNPARYVKKLGGGKGFEPWPEVAIQRFRSEANARMVWAMELAIYTGQRRSDVLAMQWRHIEDGLISVAQQKTGVRLLIPIHADLAAVLEDVPRRGTNIVHREDGRAYTGSGFAMARRSG